MQSTRQQILDHLHQQRSATVKELGRRLSMTATGVRQHLDILEREGLVVAEPERGHVGRPAFLYHLSEQGEALYPKRYDLLVNLLMEEIRQVAGADVLQRILRRVADRMAQQQHDRFDGLSVSERVEAVGQLMRDQGGAATAEQRDGVYYLHECTCPYPAVAQRNSAICALEVDLVRRLTGTDARLVSSLLRGDAACVYRLRPLEPGPSA